ncbi:MAG: tripartite tricarboxylate transporter substrate binding protein, partial [Burkholderiales bacterium]|nr:tripartite tricarboxylate transporter substrate binding protein [Burkholderiales bacterium]
MKSIPVPRALINAFRSAALSVAVVAGLATPLASMPAQAQSAAEAWPNKPLRLIVPFVPGGVTDTSGRVIAEFLGKRLGQQVVVDNKPGASGNIGTQLAATAAPDGYTLLLGFDGTMVINPHVF